MPATGPTLIRRQLGRQLRRLREAAGKTMGDIDQAGIGGRNKLWRIESGKVAVKMPDIRALCWLYGVDQATTDRLAAMAASTAGTGWQEAVAPFWFSLYVGLEAVAAEIRAYDPDLVHGLLQTPGYARAVISVGLDDTGVVERHFNLRLDRQRAALGRERPVRMTLLIGQGALQREIGGTRVLREQIAHLRRLARDGVADIRVLPWSVGAHPGLQAGPFTILDFEAPDDPAVVYFESHTTAHYLEREAELAEYRRVYDDMYQVSIPLEEP